MTGPAPVVVADPYAERTARVAAAILMAARAAGPPVRYGSAGWHALDRRDPRWVAAAFHFAEAWREHVDPVNVAVDVLEELARDRAELRQLSVDLSRAADWLSVANRPTHAELQRRRGVA